MWVTDEMVRDVVADRSFIDVGPLWDTVHEKVSVARSFGATHVTALDQFPADHPLWAAFHARMRERGVAGYGSLSMNVLDYAGPPFDVAYCSGVVYHAPDPVPLLRKLRAMTTEHLILTSSVTPAHVKNAAGEVALPDGACLYVPALSPEVRAVVGTYWAEILGDRPGGGLTNGAGYRAADRDYFNWWWLFTPQVLLAMCRACGFELVRDHLHGGFLYVLLLRAV